MCAAKMTAHDTQITLSPDFGYYVLRKNGLKDYMKILYTVQFE